MTSNKGFLQVVAVGEYTTPGLNHHNMGISINMIKNSFTVIDISVLQLHE